MKANFCSLTPLALLSSAALAHAALAAQAANDNTTPLLVINTPAILAGPSDVGPNMAFTIETGRGNFQEEGLDGMFGVTNTGNLWLKSMIGPFDAIEQLTTGVNDSATLPNYQNGRDAIVSVGAGTGLAVHYIDPSNDGEPQLTSIDALAGGSTLIATADLDGDGDAEIVYYAGGNLLAREGIAPHAFVGTAQLTTGAQDLLSIDWDGDANQDLALQLSNGGFQILELHNGSFTTLAIRQGAGTTAHIAVLKGSAPASSGQNDELAWLLRHPSPAFDTWMILTNYNGGSSNMSLFPDSWDITGVSGGELSGDSKEDLVISLANSNSTRVLIHKQNGIPFVDAGLNNLELDTTLATAAHQSPAIIGDFDEDGLADIALSAMEVAGTSVVVSWDGAEPDIQEANGQVVAAGASSGSFAYEFEVINGASDKPHFTHVDESGATVQTDDMRFYLDLDVPTLSSDLEVALFLQPSVDQGVQPRAIMHQRGLPMWGQNGFSKEYRASFLDEPGGVEYDWFNETDLRVYLFIRPESADPNDPNTIRPYKLIGMNLMYSAAGSTFETAYSTLDTGDPNFNGSAVMDTLTPGLTDGLYGWNCPSGGNGYTMSGPSPMVRGILGGQAPIKRIKKPSGETPSLGPVACVDTNLL